MKKSLAIFGAGFAAFTAVALMPSLTFAQSSTATLNVFVQVVNQYSQSRNPWDFQASVSGASASPSFFSGSANGTVVTIKAGEQYSVSINSLAGYVPSYSGACTGSASLGQTVNCFITQTAQLPYQQPTYQPSIYPYPYTQTQLSCTPGTQTVSAGSVATFTAFGGVGNSYSWTTPERTYLNVGPKISHLFTSTGTHLVTVSSGGQTATCSAVVTGSFPYQPLSEPAVGGPSYPVNVVSTFVPSRLPNTGFDPSQASAVLAFMAVFAIGGALILYPYARKVVASIR